MSLVVIRPDCSFELVPNSYTEIKEAMDGATIDLVRGPEFALFVDDEGMLNGSALNVPASLMLGICLFGSVVMCAIDPDGAGETLPADEAAVVAMVELAQQWGRVIADARRLGQDLTVVANAATVPDARVVSLSTEQFEQFLNTGRLPGDL